VQFIRKGGLRRLAVVVAVAAAGVLVVGAHAASAGTLEICKSGANGMAGKTFHYTVSPGGNPAGYNITPAGAGFTCTSVINTGAANTQATVTESDVTTTSEVQSITVIPSARKVSDNLAAKSVTVNLGTSTANETLVRYVNQPLGGTSGILKVCKITQTPSFVGRSFSFSVGPSLGNQGSLMSTVANDAFDDPANWSCRILGTFQAGSRVYVREQIPANVEVDFIDTDPGANLLDFNTDEGWAYVQVEPGTTLVLFDDEPVPPSGTGFLEICKNPPGFQDPAVTGSWHFTITDEDGLPVGPAGGVDVVTGQCTDHLVVPAGILTVTETARAGYQLTSVFTSPADALVNSNTINRTADVEVATSSVPSDETQVSFVNEAIRTQLKVCKALGPNSGVLVGQTFRFRVTDITDPEHPALLGYVSVTAGSSTLCTIFGTVPTGTVVQVDEVFAAVDDPNTKYDETGQFITTTSPATVTITPGTSNSVTITNTAFGQLEICKDLVAGLNPNVQPNFQFRIDSGGIIVVRAGSCSTARNVSVGNHTVTEIAQGNYELTAVRTDPAGRIVGTPDLGNRTVTVSVPYGPDQETAVTFTNTIRTGSVKVCKTIPSTSADSLAPAPYGRDYYFTASVQTTAGNPGAFTQYPLTVHLAAGQLSNCSNFIGPFPVLQADGNNTIVGIQEQESGGGFVVDDITLQFTRGYCSGTYPNPGAFPGQNCIPTGKDTTNRNVNFFLAPGPQSATFLQHASALTRA
jgi:hypothetical protein